MCFQVVERYELCRCLYYLHSIDPCEDYGKSGHVIERKTLLVGYTCRNHSARKGDPLYATLAPGPNGPTASSQTNATRASSGWEEWKAEWKDTGNIGGTPSIPISSVTCVWSVYDVLSHKCATSDQYVSYLENLIVLIEKGAAADTYATMHNLEAITCKEYLERRWKSLGTNLLQDIASCVGTARNTDKPESISLKCRCLKLISPTPRNVSVHFKPGSPASETLSLIDALDWICKAVRLLPASLGPFAISSSSFTVSHGFSDNLNGPELEERDIGLSLRFSLRQPLPLPEVKDNCWQPLFESCIVVESGISADDPETLGRGLEASFELLVQLAAVEFPMLIDGGIVLVGYHTVLVPTRIEGDCAQFHLEVSRPHQINPYKVKTPRPNLVQDHNQFRTMRCFLGWCGDAHINLGTEHLTTNVGYSGGQMQKRTLHWSGLTLGWQALSAGPLQAGLTGHVHLALTLNRLSFTPPMVYSQMLSNTSRQVAIVYDAEDRRAWLVPKLSLLLHMSHVWDREYEVPEGAATDNPDPIPFVEPHYSVGAVRSALQDSGDIRVRGRGEDTLTLRKLLLGLNINLLKSVDVTEECKGRHIFGFEFMDVVTEPGKGSFMKKIPIRAQGKNWLSIANDVDAVVVCSKLGQAISPVYDGNRKSLECNALPKGSDYLAAPLSCLSQLVRQQGGELSDTVCNPQIAISNRRCWALSGDPFETCPHDDKSEVTCWKKNGILQKVVRRNTFMFPKNEKQDSSSQKISLKGAVVFGEPYK
ncbi:hypothetical protein FGG08_006469 [Glutinoglossum americanum]|uniref:Uncharacterized protein n=1 Tax=Glutinoglossum americanum TaxID=1670608 RepID=A0A9P8I1G2_9PEZI|nr:hypothetical protein FGG08_006469 [Glutinoglossum americanum]